MSLPALPSSAALCQQNALLAAAAAAAQYPAMQFLFPAQQQNGIVPNYYTHQQQQLMVQSMMHATTPQARGMPNAATEPTGNGKAELPDCSTNASSCATSTSSSSSSSSSGSSGAPTPVSPLHAAPAAALVPECSNPAGAGSGSPRIVLANRELWAQFHAVTNEMVVTRAGRKMFPKLELHLRGLDPRGAYTVSLWMRQLDTCRYKYQAGGWLPAGPSGADDGAAPHTREVHHHDGLWNRGEFWMGQEKVCFDRVKLTNRDVESNTLLSLCSMHKYQPVINLYGLNERKEMVLLCALEPPETQFIAVTAYQSEAVTRLKVEHNPFAKGFREGSTRKRTLSASPPPPDAAPPAPKRTAPLVPAPVPFLYSSNSWPQMHYSPSVAATFLASMASMAQQQQNNNKLVPAGNVADNHNQQQQLELAKMYSQWWQQQLWNNQQQ